jgi:hypothetical protein
LAQLPQFSGSVVVSLHVWLQQLVPSQSVSEAQPWAQAYSGLFGAQK